MRWLWMPTIILLLFTACGRPIYETELAGFDSGKRTMKMAYKVYKEPLDDGQTGFRLENKQLYGIGNVSDRRTLRTAIVTSRFHLVRSDTTRVVNADVTHTQSWVEGDVAYVRTSENDVETASFDVKLDGPVYADLHPLLYSAELTQPGAEKYYSVLYELDGTLRDVLVRFVGPTKIYEEGRSIDVLHYQLEAITEPGEFDNYYVDPKSKGILKIQFGQIKFIPVSWLD